MRKIADHWLRSQVSPEMRAKWFQEELATWANLREPARIAAERQYYGETFPAVKANNQFRKNEKGKVK